MVGIQVTFDALLNVILAAFMLGIIWSLWKLHNDEHYREFNLVDMITARDGRVSRPACLETGAFLVSTWGFIVLINRGTLQDWYVAAYVGAFVLRAAHAAYLGHDSAVPPKRLPKPDNPDA